MNNEWIIVAGLEELLYVEIYPNGIDFVVAVAPRLDLATVFSSMEVASDICDHLSAIMEHYGGCNLRVVRKEGMTGKVAPSIMQWLVKYKVPPCVGSRAFAHIDDATAFVEVVEVTEGAQTTVTPIKTSD